MTTLADLKSYAADVAADAADGKAARVLLRHVNNAIRRVSLAHAWSFYAARHQIPLELAVDGSALTVTADSDELVLTGTEVFLQAWVDEEWDLLVGTTAHLFRLRELVTPQRARLATGQEWIGTSASAQDYTFMRSVYPLPDGCREVKDARLGTSRILLHYLSPVQFDAYKHDEPSSVGQPLCFTVRGSKLELWPVFQSTDTRDTLLLSYQRQPVVYTSASPDTAPVDFEERWIDLLERAIDVEVAAHHKGSNTLEPGLALRLYEERLQVYKSLDGGRVHQRRQFGLNLGSNLADRERWSALRTPLGDDQ